MQQKKKVIEIAELRAEPLKEVTISLPEELYSSKLIFQRQGVVQKKDKREIKELFWSVKREVVGDLKTVSIIKEKLSFIKEKEKSERDQELELLTQTITELEQKKINQIRQLRHMADEKEKTILELEKAKRAYLQSEIRNEQIKKMILEEEQRFSQLILN